jgi:hypothetical protein
MRARKQENGTRLIIEQEKETSLIIGSRNGAATSFMVVERNPMRAKLVERADA